jgi:hypothetical protein
MLPYPFKYSINKWAILAEQSLAVRGMALIILPFPLTKHPQLSVKQLLKAHVQLIIPFSMVMLCDSAIGLLPDY